MLNIHQSLKIYFSIRFLSYPCSTLYMTFVLARTHYDDFYCILDP